MREALFKAGSMVRREGAREGACELGSMVVRQATSPTPSNDSFCSQPGCMGMDDLCVLAGPICPI